MMARGSLLLRSGAPHYLLGETVLPQLVVYLLGIEYLLGAEPSLLGGVARVLYRVLLL